MPKHELAVDKARETWDALWRSRKRLYVYRNVLNAAQSFLGDLSGRTALEVGCGRGATLLELARHGAHVVGLDYSEEALTFCRELHSRTRVAGNVAFLNGDAARLPFGEGAFDFVYSVGLIEHFRDPMQILAEQQRVLRPGGFLLVQVPQKYSLYTVVKKVMMHLGKWPYGGWETQFSDKEISKLVRNSGLQPEQVYGYGSFLLAAIRHTFAPNLDFGVMWRNGSELKTLRAVKSKTALEICVVAMKKAVPAERDSR